MSEHLQVVKPRARFYPARDGGWAFWTVCGSGYIRTGITLKATYERWAESYINGALYGSIYNGGKT